MRFVHLLRRARDVSAVRSLASGLARCVAVVARCNNDSGLPPLRWNGWK